MFFARVESSSNILQLLATGVNPAICLQMTIVLQPLLFFIALFNFVATVLIKEVSRLFNKKVA
jgi:hypothetical protein